jgi:hypothetical protein
MEIIAEKVTFLSSSKNEKIAEESVDNEDTTEINVVKEDEKKYNRKKK